MQKFAQFSVFGLNGINLLNDFRQIGIVHNIINNAAHEFRVRHERGLNVFYIIQCHAANPGTAIYAYT